MSADSIEPELDYIELNRQLDRTKSRVFIGKNAAFLGSILCSLEFIWDTTTPTAWVNGCQVGWNPHFYLSLPPEERETVMVHELWHPAQLYWVRRGDRDPDTWNRAADFRINSDLKTDGYVFDELLKIGVCLDDKYKDPEQWPIEAIYDDLKTNPPPPPPQGGGGPSPGACGGQDTVEPTSAQKQKSINSVINAITVMRMSGEAGNIPGVIEQTLKKFLAPIVPWQTLLFKFFNDMFDTDFSWRVRDRRFQEIYLPGEEETDGKLEHLMYIIDVSGSVTDAQEVRFTSEVKYIKDTFNPTKLTIVQFDTIIQKIQVITEDEPFDEITIVGRGGTDLTPVRALIEEQKPTAAIIFSDLFVEPMKPLSTPIPLIWVCVSNRSAQVPAGGTVIHINA